MIINKPEIFRYDGSISIKDYALSVGRQGF